MKYIHMSGDDGTLSVRDKAEKAWYGEIFEVPDDFRLELDLEELDGYTHLYEMLHGHPHAKKVHVDWTEESFKKPLDSAD